MTWTGVLLVVAIGIVAGKVAGWYISGGKSEGSE